MPNTLSKHIGFPRKPRREKVPPAHLPLPLPSPIALRFPLPRHSKTSRRDETRQKRFLLCRHWGLFVPRFRGSTTFPYSTHVICRSCRVRGRGKHRLSDKPTTAFAGKAGCVPLSPLPFSEITCFSNGFFFGYSNIENLSSALALASLICARLREKCGDAFFSLLLFRMPKNGSDTCGPFFSLAFS
jgi:hypothetical protein